MWTGWIVYRLIDDRWLRERVVSLHNSIAKGFGVMEADVTMTDAQLDMLMPYWGRVIWGMSHENEATE